MNAASRIEAMRRLGIEFVTCDECSGTMRKPKAADGPQTLWHTHGRGSRRDTTPYYVCSSGCRDRLRARLKAKEARR